ncbi:hypothetical protein N9O40_00105 [Planktomarina sp.]|nr:hypothetical protein [Planktomarina sp.]
MKHILLAFTLIFSVSGSVNAKDNNNRWVLIISQTSLVDTFTSVHQSQGFGDYRMGALTASECYENLKKDALWRNQTSNNFKGENRFRIEIVDDEIISAKARWMTIQYEIHCVQITLD